MGCDIHAAIEVLRVKTAAGYEHWRFVAQPDDDRNYEFFSLLAGVRGDCEPWLSPRGWPAHLDSTTYGDEYRGVVDGDHTPSWFTLAEAREFPLPKTARDSTRTQWERWLKTMEFFAELYGVTPDDVRAVFNFDN